MKSARTWEILEQFINILTTKVDFFPQIWDLITAKLLYSY